MLESLPAFPGSSKERLSGSAINAQSPPPPLHGPEDKTHPAPPTHGFSLDFALHRAVGVSVSTAPAACISRKRKSMPAQVTNSLLRCLDLLFDVVLRLVQRCVRVLITGVSIVCVLWS